MYESVTKNGQISRTKNILTIDVSLQLHKESLKHFSTRNSTIPSECIHLDWTHFMQNPSPFFVQVEPRPRYHRSASRFNVITLLQYSILMKTWAIIYISLEVITLKNIALVALLSRKVFFCIKWSLLGIPCTWQFLIVDLRWAYLAKLLSKGRTTVHMCDVPLLENLYRLSPFIIMLEIPMEFANNSKPTVVHVCPYFSAEWIFLAISLIVL